MIAESPRVSVAGGGKGYLDRGRLSHQSIRHLGHGDWGLFVGRARRGWLVGRTGREGGEWTSWREIRSYGAGEGFRYFEGGE